VVTAQQVLDGFRDRQRDAGVTIDVGTVVTGFPARCVALDHAAIAWAHATGLPAPATPNGLAGQLLVSTTGIAYATSPVPYVWWRRWEDLALGLQAARRWGVRYRTMDVYASDRVAPFEGRAFALAPAAGRALMDLAVQHGAVAAAPPRR